MEQKNDITFLVSFTKKDLLEAEPAVNFHTKKALITTLIFTTICLLVLIYKQYLIGFLLFCYCIYGILCHYFSFIKLYNTSAKKNSTLSVTISNNKLIVDGKILKSSENYFDTVNAIIETNNLLILTTNDCTLLSIRKNSINNISLDVFKTYLLNICPNLQKREVYYFTKIQKHYPFLALIIFICGILSTMLYFV